MNPTPSQSEREKLARQLSEMYYLAINVYPPSTNDFAGFRVLADLIIQEKRNALIKGAEKLLNDLQRTYPLIRKPIPQSPMELTEEAKVYNKVVADLNLFIGHWRRKLATLTPKTTKEDI